MNLPGHIAVSYLLGRAPERPGLTPWLAALAGTVTPDLIDKSVQALGVTPYGRTVGHSALLWGWISVVAVYALGRRLPRARAVSWLALGGLAHLATDLVDDLVEGFQVSGYVFSAWLGWPWTNPDMMNVRVTPLFGPGSSATSILEVLTVLACAVILYRDRGARRVSR